MPIFSVTMRGRIASSLVPDPALLVDQLVLHAGQLRQAADCRGSEGRLPGARGVTGTGIYSGLALPTHTRGPTSLNREIRHRTDTVGVSPDRNSADPPRGSHPRRTTRSVDRRPPLPRPRRPRPQPDPHPEPQHRGRERPLTTSASAPTLPITGSCDDRGETSASDRSCRCADGATARGCRGGGYYL